MNKNESIKELAAALSKAQSELKALDKNASNNFFKSNYADLSESVEKILPVLSKHGLSVSQGPMYLDCGWVMETCLMHSSGEWLAFIWPIMLNKDKPGPQDFASSASYARRYGLQAIVSAAAHDDDANVAQGKGSPTQPTPHREPEKPLKNYAPGADDEIGFKGLEESKRSEPFDQRLETKIEFGKYVGKTLKDVGQTAAVSYVKWLKDSAKAQNKDMNDRVKGFCELVESVWGKCD